MATTLFLLHRTLLATALVGAIRQPLAAQTARSTVTSMRRQGGVITGVVVDSLTGLPLHGVMVVVVGKSATSRQRTSDQAGRFRFDSLAPGSYVASAASRLLDTARVTFRLAAGDSVLVTLATRGRVAPPILSSERRAQLAGLDSARARWLRNRPVAYRFHVRNECFCFPAAPGPIIEVRGNVVTTIGPDGVRRLVTPDSAKMFTIEGFFDYMLSVAGDERELLRDVQYDATFGYPRRFTTESSSGITDTWLQYFIEGFEAVEPRTP
jgi:hypothetical protein